MLMSLRAWSGFALVYYVIVILFGALVRASGSGAGCGNHWPLCNGQFVPYSPAIQTVIEYSHRITSGLCLPIAIVVLALAYRSGIATSWRWARWTFFFLMLEAAIGAGLVKFEYVAFDQSFGRILVMSFHLVNTLFLTAAALFTWRGSFDRRMFAVRSAMQVGKIRAMIVAMLLTAVSGAITALGDTVFPVSTSGAAINQAVAGGHVLMWLRLFHPVIAILSGVFIWQSSQSIQLPEVDYPLQILRKLVIIQLGLGGLNVILSAPVWLQIVHLGFSQLIWLAIVSVAWKAGCAGTASKRGVSYGSFSTGALFIARRD